MVSTFFQNLTTWNVLGYVMYGLAFGSIIAICIREHKQRTFDTRKIIALIVSFFVVIHFFFAQTLWLATYAQIGELSFAKTQWIMHDAVVGILIAILLAIIETEK